MTDTQQRVAAVSYTHLDVYKRQPESRETFQRTQNTMRQKMSREISKPVSKSWKAF